MKNFFDTSVLVAAFVEDHPHHERSFSVFAKSSPGNGCCAAHTLAEFYSALTRLPGKHRASGDQVVLMLEGIEERLEIVPLNLRDYRAVILESAKAGITGGTIYDMLLARCALNAHATTVYTWNLSHFQRLGAEIADRVRTP